MATNVISKRQIRVPVNATEYGRLDQGSYSQAAAATSLASDPALMSTDFSVNRFSEENDNDKDGAAQLRLRIVLALASLCEASKSGKVEIGKSTLSLEKALEKQHLEVLPAKRKKPGFLVKYGGQEATIESTETLSSTLQACNVLRRNDGRTQALDNNAVDVTIAKK